jgi:putative transposase
MGISQFCIDSNGNFIENPKHFKKYERKIRIANRSLARKEKGSNRWKKQAKNLSKLHHTIGNVRKDFLHKESTKIAKLHKTIYMEDLCISNMVKNKILSKHILDCGWGLFRNLLSCKTKVILVNPRYTSQTCNECGIVDSKSRLSQSEFVCTNCGHVSNADVNAAKNILSKGIALSRKRESIDCALALESHYLQS